MPVDKPDAFTRLADGTILMRQEDGSFLPIGSKTDRTRLASLPKSEIERMSMADPDHPPLDDSFWADIDVVPAAKEAISIKLDADILAHFRRPGRGYQTRINAVLRRYVDSRHKSG